MTFALVNTLIVGTLFASMLLLQEFGRRVGERDSRRRPGNEKRNPGAAEGAVYGVLGLFLAFTFSGAGARFEERRHLVVQEANAIATAWLRTDLLPPSARSHVRELLRQYVDTRLEYYRLMHETDAVVRVRKTSLALRNELWSAGIAAADATEDIAPATVFLPALNEMLDSMTTREEATHLHPPTAVFLMVAILVLIGAVFAGYGMAGRARSWIHTLGFAAVMTMALFVIIDLEFPRLGLIRVDVADAVLLDVRQSMQ